MHVKGFLIMDLQLTDKTALVLASSSGLGKAIATELAKEGTNVVIASRTEEKLQKALADIEEVATGQVKYKVFDQTNLKSIKELVQFTRDAFGKIDILVTNSGGPQAGTFEKFTDEDVDEAFQLTLNSYIRVIREVLPDLKETKGRILMNTSSSIKQPIPGLTLSNIFRAGMLGLGKTLSQELAPYGILVNVIAPGRIYTERIQQLNEINAKKQGKDQKTFDKEDQANIPMDRYGKPEEFAKTAAYLVSYANTYTTGQTVLVDGGLSDAL